MKMYALKRASGAVSIMYLYDADADIKNEVAKWQEQSPDDLCVSYREITPDMLPEDKDFRDAWTDGFDTPTIDVCFDTAKALTKARLRKERLPLLGELDAAYMIASEQGHSTDEIVAEKQRLRDITKVADAAKSLEELKAISI